jgi:ATP adenylyltransferase
MHHLWAPWRLSYVTKTGAAEDDDRCVFCEEVVGSTPSSLTLHRGDRCFVILNKYPYSNGHLMVVPRRHIGRLSEAAPDELTELMALTRTAEMALTEAYAPHGLNVGMNLGRPAGAGVVGHLHIHVVPRWNGDTNFMTVTADTRVVPEEPAQTVERLRPIFLRLSS